MEDLERTQEQYSGRGSVCSAVSDAFYFTKLRGEPEGTVLRQEEGEPTESRTFTYETADGESQQIDLEVHPVERETQRYNSCLSRRWKNGKRYFWEKTNPKMR